MPEVAGMALWGGPFACYHPQLKLVHLNIHLKRSLLQLDLLCLKPEDWANGRVGELGLW
jgi:hypothetical protein